MLYSVHWKKNAKKAKILGSIGGGSLYPGIRYKEVRYRESYCMSKTLGPLPTKLDISGGTKKTFPTFRSSISDNWPLVASKFGSLIVQYVLNKYAELQYNCFRNVFLLKIFVFYVKNCNIKIAVT